MSIPMRVPVAMSTLSTGRFEREAKKHRGVDKEKDADSEDEAVMWVAKHPLASRRLKSSWRISRRARTDVIT